MHIIYIYSHLTPPHLYYMIRPMLRPPSVMSVAYWY